MKDARDDLQAVLDAVVDLLQQHLLLPGAPFELAIGAFELATLVQIAQLLQLSEEPHAHVASRRLRIVEQQPSELLVQPQHGLDVVLELKLRMEQGPVMGRSDERQEAHQHLEVFAAEGLPQRSPGPLGTGRLDEDDRRRGEDPVLELAVGLGPRGGHRRAFQAIEDDIELAPPWRKGLQQPDRLRDRLRPRRRVTGGVAVPQQEGAMPGDAIAHPAKAGQVDEQPSLNSDGIGVSK